MFKSWALFVSITHLYMVYVIWIGIRTQIMANKVTVFGVSGRKYITQLKWMAKEEQTQKKNTFKQNKHHRTCKSNRTTSNNNSNTVRLSRLFEWSRSLSLSLCVYHHLWMNKHKTFVNSCKKSSRWKLRKFRRERVWEREREREPVWLVESAKQRCINNTERVWLRWRREGKIITRRMHFTTLRFFVLFSLLFDSSVIRWLCIHGHQYTWTRTRTQLIRYHVCVC